MAIPREPSRALLMKAKEGLRRDYTPAPQISLCYLLGVLHDATKRKTTYRIATKSLNYCKFIKKEINNLNVGAWFYKEGKDRNLWIVEFSRSLLKGVEIKSRQDKIDYIRGYFDSDGGIAKNSHVRYYIYFAQKDKSDLEEVKIYLEHLRIICGRLHNPSKRVDPNYWRFYVSAKSYKDFARTINSAHPDKRKYLRMKI
jgi:hypothetical protein